jgi:hypothetical protein
MRNDEHPTTNATGGDPTNVIQRLGGTVIDVHPTGRSRLDPLDGLGATGGCKEATGADRER